MKPLHRRVVELKGYRQPGPGLLPAIRQVVQDQLDDRAELCDIGLSRQGERIYLHLYYTPFDEGG